jgi:hypothetical protein
MSLINNATCYGTLINNAAYHHDHGILINNAALHGILVNNVAYHSILTKPLIKYHNNAAYQGILINNAAYNVILTTSFITVYLTAMPLITVPYIAKRNVDFSQHVTYDLLVLKGRHVELMNTVHQNLLNVLNCI